MFLVMYHAETKFFLNFLFNFHACFNGVMPDEQQTMSFAFN